MHHISFVSAPYFFRFCRIYAIIAKPSVFNTPRDLANVNEWQIIFDPYINHPIDSLYTVESVKDTVPVIERILGAKDAR